VLRGPARDDGYGEEGALCASYRRAHAEGKIGGGGYFPGLETTAGSVLTRGDGQNDGAPALISALDEPDAAKSCRGGHGLCRRCGDCHGPQATIPTRSPTACVFLHIRGALDVGANDHTRQMEIAHRARHCRAGAQEETNRYRSPLPTAAWRIWHLPGTSACDGRCPHIERAAEYEGKKTARC